MTERWDVARHDEQLALQAIVNRGLAQLRDLGATVVRGEEEWRAWLVISKYVAFTLYGREVDLVDTILKCDCPCPSECGTLVARICTLKETSGDDD